MAILGRIMRHVLGLTQSRNMSYDSGRGMNGEGLVLYRIRTLRRMYRLQRAPVLKPDQLQTVSIACESYLA